MVSLGKTSPFVFAMERNNNRYLTFYVANDGYYGAIIELYTRKYITMDLQKERALTFEKLIKPNKRQYVYYAPYEIDSFAAGNKFFVLTYQELKGCMAIEL